MRTWWSCSSHRNHSIIFKKICLEIMVECFFKPWVRRNGSFESETFVSGSSLFSFYLQLPQCHPLGFSFLLHKWYNNILFLFPDLAVWWSNQIKCFLNYKVLCTEQNIEHYCYICDKYDKWKIIKTHLQYFPFSCVLHSKGIYNLDGLQLSSLPSQLERNAVTPAR